MNSSHALRIGRITGITVMLSLIAIFLGADLHYWSIYLWTLWCITLISAAAFTLLCDSALED